MHSRYGSAMSKRIAFMLFLLTQTAAASPGNFVFPQGLPEAPMSCILSLEAKAENHYTYLRKISCDGQSYLEYSGDGLTRPLEIMSGLAAALSRLNITAPQCFSSSHGSRGTEDTLYCPFAPAGTKLLPIGDSNLIVTSGAFRAQPSLSLFLLSTGLLYQLAILH